MKTSGEDNSFDHFVGVKLDGKELVKDKDYTVEKGSTIVTLAPETLEKLSVGEHNATILFDNGEVNTTLTILEKGIEKSPKTADSRTPVIWVVFSSLSIFAAAAYVLLKKKEF